MAWNESGNGKNPWDRRPRNDGPPDLDKIVRDWQRRIGALFGDRGGDKGGGRDSGTGRSGSEPSGKMLVGLLVLLLLGWGASGLYRVNEAERGVVTRFGAYVSTAMPGLRWHIPWPIEQVEKVNVAKVNKFSQETRMLTADENIVVVDLVVQYQKTDAVMYLFNIRSPDETLQDVSESAIREVIGKNTADYVLLEGRAEIAVRTAELIQETLDDYKSGIVVTKVNLQDTNFPSQVEDAVQDAIKAREDKERLALEAQSYANDIVPKARGAAARQMQDAEAYKAQVIANAEGEADRFEKLLIEYKKAPGITRERLYLDAIEQVYRNSSKVLLDTEGSGNLLYLPVDKLLENQTNNATRSRSDMSSRPPTAPQGSDNRNSRDSRSRGVR